jgi:hypothetical protein
MTTSTYRYLFADLLTGSILAELPLTNVNFTQAQNAAGTFSGDIIISDATEPALNIINATQPARTALYVDRNGVLIWGGIIWYRQYDSESQHLQLTAREFLSYFERRRINTDQTYTSTDQLAIARNLIALAQSTPNGNIGVQVGAETSGVLISRTFHAYEQKTVYAALLELSQATNGFDFDIQVAYDGGGNPTATLRLGYPRLGTAYSSTNVSAPVLDFPGNAIAYQYAEDGSLAATSFTAVGAGSNEGQIQSNQISATQLAAGWPLLEDVASYSDLTDTTLLGNLATGRLNASINPPVTLQMTMPPYADPTLGTYSVGDDVRVRIDDDRFPNLLDVPNATDSTTYRLVGLTVTPGESSGERVTLSLTLGTY